MYNISSKLFCKTLELGNFKYWVEKSLKHPPRTTKPLFPKAYKDKFTIEEFQVMNYSVFTLVPDGIEGNRHIIYFHGGAYIFQGNIMQRKLVEYIATHSQSTISYIDYPLVPENTYRETFEMVRLSYITLLKLHPEDEFMLMGDSAGGGLALAFAQFLLKQNPDIQPLKTVLFSPWLDITMKHPDIKALEDIDKILPLKGLVEIGEKYAGGDNPQHYLLSPIYGEFEKLGETIIFYGTNEILYPDCKKLRDEVVCDNTNFTFYEFPSMPHDWVIFPIIEARQALDIAVEFIKK